MVALATAATIVASQALIAAVFSLTRQAAQLGFAPRVNVVHTSGSSIGQIYLPSLNWLLLAATVGVVVAFRSSDRLAAAFGLAVSTTMAITTVLFGIVARSRFRWPLLARRRGRRRISRRGSRLRCRERLQVPGRRVVAGRHRRGGVHGDVDVVRRPTAAAARDARSAACPSRTFSRACLRDPPHRVQASPCFSRPTSTSCRSCCCTTCKHNQVLHETVVLLKVSTEDVPRVRN